MIYELHASGETVMASNKNDGVPIIIITTNKMQVATKQANSSQVSISQTSSRQPSQESVPFAHKAASHIVYLSRRVINNAPVVALHMHINMLLRPKDSLPGFTVSAF
jgi:hypothetical protein